MLRELVDIHVHVGDSNHRDGAIPRLLTIEELDAMGIVAVAKAHFLAFVPESQYIHGSVTLNNSLDPERVRLAATEMTKPWFAYLPSLNAAAHHQAVADDAAWRKLFAGVEMGAPISVLTESGDLKLEAKEVIWAIKETGAIMATGHLSAWEVESIVPYALTVGIKKIVLTHVSSRHNRLSIEIQQKLMTLAKAAGSEVFAEHSAITWYDGKDGAYDLRRDFVMPIRIVGAGNCIISSDSGRVVVPGRNVPSTPLDCLRGFADLLIEGGLTETETQQMLVENPRRLLS